ELGDYEAAVTAGNQSLARFRAAEADSEAASLENELALVQLAMGNLKAASKHAAAAHDHFQRVGDQRWLAHVTDTESRIALAAGKATDASALASEALGLADVTGDRKAAIDASLTLAKAQRASGDLAAASATLERTALLARQLGRRGQLQAVLGEWG